MMRTLGQVICGLSKFWSLRLRNAQLPKPEPILLPTSQLVEEERYPDYDPATSYQVHPGNVLNKRYLILSKLGYGALSTIWLARDTNFWSWNRHRFVALKVGISDATADSQLRQEVKFSHRMKQTAAEDPSSVFLRHALDHFEIRREDGAVHQCITYAVLRETLGTFQRRFKDGKLPVIYVKCYVKFLLRGLDVLHRKCNYVHGDLKSDNILLSFEEPSVLSEYVESLEQDPMPRKVVGDRTTYLSRPDFGPLKDGDAIATIIDFDKAQPGDGMNPTRHPVQAAAYRAPEVLMGMPWSYSLDIWNLGVLIWNMMEDRDLFTNIGDADGKYNARAHVAEMIALLGHPPPEFLAMEQEWRDVAWFPPIVDRAGDECWYPRDFWGGPFFDNDRLFLYEDKIPKGLLLSDTVHSLDDGDKTLFMNFIGQMLCWLPEHRKTAKDLIDHPWLDVEAEARRMEQKQVY